MSNSPGPIDLGPLLALLSDPAVDEIMVDGPHQIIVERHGKMEDVTETFRDEKHLMEIIANILTPLGLQVNESNPIVDAHLSDDSRVHIVIPPIALNGPFMVIRKFRKESFTADDLVRLGTWSAEMASFLQACVVSRLNIAMAGGTGTGKTAVFNILVDAIADEDRILVVQNAGDLVTHKKRLIRQESRPANLEGKVEVSLQRLVKSAIKMRPDRILLSDAQGAEVLDLLGAMNTGHNGCMFSIHASNPRDVLSRLEMMATLGNLSVPLLSIREQIASSLNIIVYVGRLPDGSRRILKICEITGMAGDPILLQDIFEFRQAGRDSSGHVNGQFSATGIIPRVSSRIRDAGVELPMSLFTPR